MRTSTTLLLATLSVATACALPELTQNPDYVEDGASGGAPSDGNGGSPSDGSGATSDSGGSGASDTGGTGPSGDCDPQAAPTCYDAITPQSCNSEGQWVQQAPCQGDAPHCNDATGTCVVCEPDVTECQDNTSMHCLSDGSAWEELEVCSGLRPACLAATGTCGSCTEGDVQCVGDALRTCQSDQTWGISDSCDSATPQCFDKACHECDPEEGNGRSCDGQTPRVCVDGNWVDEEECGGDLPNCSPKTGRCVCTEGETRGEYVCTGGNGLEQCTGGAWVRLAECGGWSCVNGACYRPPSCLELSDTQCQGQPCCSRIALAGSSGFPMGEGESDGTYGPEHDVQLSAFSLDKFEVTVGRFRAFLEHFTIPSAGDGAVPNSDDPGWDTAWNVELSPDHTGNCNEDGRTWTETIMGNEERPMNCVAWPMAYAFCIWDGGRLPTEAEWEYAAAGGEEDRKYPWGEASPTCELANNEGCFGAPQDVGLNPFGDARWGHSDMGGNLQEHVRDYMDRDFYDKPEASDRNAINLTPVAGQEDARVIKGAHYSDPGPYAEVFARNDSHFDSHQGYRGVRCARAP